MTENLMEIRVRTTSENKINLAKSSLCEELNLVEREK